MAADEVMDLLAALRTGAISVEDVAQRFRERKWARSRRPIASQPHERAGQLDPPLPVEGSIDDLIGAYDRGELTWEQYRVLARAVADSIDAG